MKQKLIITAIAISVLIILRAGISTAAYAAELYTKEKLDNEQLEYINQQLNKVDNIDALAMYNNAFSVSK